MAPEPAKAPRINPTTAWLCWPNVTPSSDPPTENTRPPSIQVDPMVGSAVANARRAERGIDTRGRRAATAPAFGSTVSGSTAVLSARATKADVRMTKTNRVGCGPYWISTPVPTAPSPSPPVAATLLTSDPSRDPFGGCRSSRYAPTTPIAAPVAKPCTIRAANSAGTPCASRKTAIAPASTSSDTASTGRRPK